MALKILVADKLAEEGLEFLKSSGIDFDTKVGLKEDELAAAVGGYDALIVRSGAKVTAKVPLRRLATKDEIADLALFLSSEAAAYITGAIIVCDGGQSLSGHTLGLS